HAVLRTRIRPITAQARGGPVDLPRSVARRVLHHRRRRRCVRRTREGRRCARRPDRFRCGVRDDHVDSCRVRYRSAVLVRDQGARSADIEAVGYRLGQRLALIVTIATVGTFTTVAGVIAARSGHGWRTPLLVASIVIGVGFFGVLTFTTRRVMYAS